MKEVYIVSAVRTPIGSFGGSLSSLSAVQLGAAAVKGAIAKINLDPKSIQEVYMGNVISAGLGQAPATQVAVAAGLGYEIPCTQVNKVCASGMKAIMVGAQSIMLGQNDVVVAGGMESMSNIPYYIPKARFGYKFGNGELIDGLSHDGLTDIYNHCAMGVCSDNTAKEMNISREEQDAYAIAPYKRTAAAWATGKFKEEVVSVEIKGRKGEVTSILEDEEYKNVNFEKIPALKPVFGKDGTATAANASTINDGAAAVILMSKEKADELDGKYKDQNRFPFSVYVGIATGYAKVGNIGPPEKVDYTVIGSVVNKASRLDSAGNAGDILMDEDTYFFVKDDYDIEDFGSHELKGFEKKVQIFKLTI